MTESALYLAFREAHLAAINKYWGYQPKANSSIEYSRKQQQYQEHFELEKEFEIKGRKVKIIFLGKAAWRAKRLCDSRNFALKCNPEEWVIFVSMVKTFKIPESELDYLNFRVMNEN